MHSYPYRSTSFWTHLVAEYTGLSLPDVLSLRYLQYLQWQRDAYIHRLEQTEQGREYLDNAWRMEQTKPDREKLRKRARSPRWRPTASLDAAETEQSRDWM